MDYEAEIKLLADVPDGLDLQQYVLDAGIDIVNNVQKFIPQDLNMFTQAVPVEDSSGINFETGVVHFVERMNKTCIEIPAEKKNQALDAGSLDFATAEYPAFYRENKRLYVIPGPQESTDPLAGFYPVFMKSSMKFKSGDISRHLTDIIFTTGATVNELQVGLKGHNLETGDIVSIKFTGGNSGDPNFSGDNLNIIRRNAWVFTVGVEWLPDEVLLDETNFVPNEWDTQFIPNWFLQTGYYDPSHDYYVESTLSQAHIVQLPSQFGAKTSVNELHYSYKTNEFIYSGD